jgi:hypothetical protein
MVSKGVSPSFLFAAVLLAAGVPETRGQTPRAALPAEAGGETMSYRVNYRPSDSAPWQIYAQTRSLNNANSIAAELRQGGYQAEVVNSLTPSPQPYPDATEYSASNYYPSSNWTNDYNYYLVPGGGNYNYGWFGGFLPGWGYSYPWYWWNGGNYWHNGWWRGHGWYHGWRGGWHNGWSSAYRSWNHSHVDRQTHESHSDRHARNAHHTSAHHNNTAGHHTPGHHAAAHHGNRHAGEHPGTGHAPQGGRNMGHVDRAHRAAGHAARGHAAGGRHGGAHRSGGSHAAGHHAAHLDP